MIFELAAMAAICVFILVFNEIERYRWSKERQKLLDRVQTRSLGEYMAYSDKHDEEDAMREPDEETELL